MVAFSLLQSTEPVLVPTVFKETVSRARVDFFYTLPGLQINRPKGFTKLFVFAKNMWLRSCWLCWYRVSVVVDYVDTHFSRIYSWKRKSSRTQCRRSQRLRGHINEYADTFENFEGFAQILKEQSGKKRYLGVFTHTIAIIYKF